MASQSTITFPAPSAVAKGTSQLSWRAMPQSRWQQPEFSIGLPHTPLDFLGMYKCWSVKDKSPAHLAWKTISKALVGLLGDRFEHLGAGDSELMIEMFMIGRKPTSSNPTILFSCQSKLCRQKAMEMTQKKGILVNHPGILMAECARLPRLLALEDESELPSLLPGVYLNGPLRSYGTPVIIYSEHHTAPRKATIGGIVSIEDELYGVTTAHAFFGINDGDTNRGQDLEFAFYGGDEPYASSDDDEGILNRSTSQGKR
jgi:hypothetical protein